MDKNYKELLGGDKLNPPKTKAENKDPKKEFYLHMTGQPTGNPVFTKSEVDEAAKVPVETLPLATQIELMRQDMRHLHNLYNQTFAPDQIDANKLRQVAGELDTLQNVTADIMSSMDTYGQPVVFGSLARPGWTGLGERVNQLAEEDVPKLHGMIEAMNHNQRTQAERTRRAENKLMAIENTQDSMSDRFGRIESDICELKRDRTKARLKPEDVLSDDDKRLLKAYQKRLNGLDDTLKGINDRLDNELGAGRYFSQRIASVEARAVGVDPARMVRLETVLEKLMENPYIESNSLKVEIDGLKECDVSNSRRIESLEAELKLLKDQDRQTFPAAATGDMIKKSPKCFGQMWDPFDDGHCNGCEFFNDCARSTAAAHGLHIPALAERLDEQSYQSERKNWSDFTPEPLVDEDEPCSSDEWVKENEDLFVDVPCNNETQTVVVQEQKPRSAFWVVIRIIELILLAAALGALIVPKL